MTHTHRLFVPAPPGWKVATWDPESGPTLDPLIGWDYKPSTGGYLGTGRHVTVDVESATIGTESHRPWRRRLVQPGDEFDLDDWTSTARTEFGQAVVRALPHLRARVAQGEVTVRDDDYVTAAAGDWLEQAGEAHWASAPGRDLWLAAGPGPDEETPA